MKFVCLTYIEKCDLSQLKLNIKYPYIIKYLLNNIVIHNTKNVYLLWQFSLLLVIMKFTVLNVLQDRLGI